MAARGIELILAKQWAGLLVTPVMLFDGSGTLVYYNEAMELLLGRSFGLTGPMVRGEWSAAFHFQDLDGNDLHPGLTPLGATLDGAQAEQRTCFMQGAAGKRSKICITTVPIQGAGEERHGALALFTSVS
jgi:hypothetical protein